MMAIRWLRAESARWWLVIAACAVTLGSLWTYLPGNYVLYPVSLYYCDWMGDCHYSTYLNGYLESDTVLHGTQMNVRLFLCVAAFGAGLCLAGLRGRPVTLTTAGALAGALLLTISQRQGAFALLLGAALWAIWPAVRGPARARVG